MALPEIRLKAHQTNFLVLCQIGHLRQGLILMLKVCMVAKTILIPVSGGPQLMPDLTGRTQITEVKILQACGCDTVSQGRFGEPFFPTQRQLSHVDQNADPPGLQLLNEPGHVKAFVTDGVKHTRTVTDLSRPTEEKGKNRLNNVAHAWGHTCIHL